MIKLALIALIIWGLFFLIRNGRRAAQNAQNGQNSAMGAGRAYPRNGAANPGGRGFGGGKPVRIEELVACPVCGIYATASVKKPCGHKNCPRGN
ncbi:MAG: hypothetical protein ORN98_00755 [Alphaproteobacteria bacterium]|nr:hypothetical protein [Alphaproteobacteria bacterium]